jgi:hypothetical protein
MQRMPSRRKNPSMRIAVQAVEMSAVVPYVVAHRLADMAGAGASPSARDRKEFALMVNEKVLAFYQWWGAMWLQAYRSQMQLAQRMIAAPMVPTAGRRRSASSSAALASAATKVLAAGLAPVHGKAVANSKRLARRKK